MRKNSRSGRKGTFNGSSCSPFKRYEDMVRSYNYDYRTRDFKQLDEFIGRNVPHKNGSKKPDAS